MEINIIAPGHPSQEKMKEFYTNLLNKRFGKMAFLVSAEVRVKIDDFDDYEVSILMNPTTGADLFAKDKHAIENTALKGAIRKIMSQIDKHKGKHFDPERVTIEE